jgi:hypothetical protein
MTVQDHNNIVTTAVRLVVDQHYLYRPEAPELFPWEKVINLKVAAVAQNLVQEIADRRVEWALMRRSGDDPHVCGLQEALRVIARIAIWRVQSEQQARLNEDSRRGRTHAYHLPDDTGNDLPPVPLSLVRASRV